MHSRVILVVLLILAAAAPSFAEERALPQLAANAFPLPVPTYLSSIIAEAAAKYRVDPNLIAAMAFRESPLQAG